MAQMSPLERTYLPSFAASAASRIAAAFCLVACVVGQVSAGIYAPDAERSLEESGRRLQKELTAKRVSSVRVVRADGLLTRRKLSDGRGIQLMGFRKGLPQFYITLNANAAATVGADDVWPGGPIGLGLTGQGVVLGLWDEAAVRTTHQELVGRVSQADPPLQLSSHTTHVAGTMIASGIQSDARGMSYEGRITAYDWNGDASEMRSAAAGGLRVSNHSYGYSHGWLYDGVWWWLGEPSVSSTEDYLFGFYDELAAEWDDIAYNAPDYLIVKSAGNDRGEGPAAGTAHLVWSGSSYVWSTAVREVDGGASGYDTLGDASVAKNVLVIGAVSDLTSGYGSPSGVALSSFSAFGPTDDGRIKPDLVANGAGLYSCAAGSDASYASSSGTSMSSPNVAGAIGLLLQHFADNAGALAVSPHAATMKAVLIHTASEAGSSNGPDYRHGWGLLNVPGAAEVIRQAVSEEAFVIEDNLANGQTQTIQVWASGDEPLKATVCWTDPAGTVPQTSLDPSTKMLVNDLDLRIAGGATHYPWTLDPGNPGSPASTGDNDRDNVEQVVVESPPLGLYTIRVSHKGRLRNASQPYSLVVTGVLRVPFEVRVQSTPPAGVPMGGTHPGVTEYVFEDSPNTSVALTAPETFVSGQEEYAFQSWYLDGVPVGSGERTVDFILKKDTVCVADYASPVALSVLSTPVTGVTIEGEIGGVTDYTGYLAKESWVVLTAPEFTSSEDKPYAFTRWWLGSSPLPDGQRTVNFTLSQDTTCVAEYREVSTYSLSVLSYPVAGVPIEGTHPEMTNHSETVPENAWVVLTAPTAFVDGATDYAFVRWWLNGHAVATGYTTINFLLTSDTTAVAEYETVPKYTLDVWSYRAGNVDIAGTHAGVTNYSVPLAQNTWVVLTAPQTTVDGSTSYGFVRWWLTGYGLPIGSLTTNFVLTGDTFAVAEYEEARQHTLTVVSFPVSGGVVTGSHAGTTNYEVGAPEGTWVALTAPGNVNSGGAAYAFVRWWLGSYALPEGIETANFVLQSDTVLAAEYRQTSVSPQFSVSGRPATQPAGLHTADESE